MVWVLHGGGGSSLEGPDNPSETCNQIIEGPVEPYDLFVGNVDGLTECCGDLAHGPVKDFHVNTWHRYEMWKGRAVDDKESPVLGLLLVLLLLFALVLQVVRRLIISFGSSTDLLGSLGCHADGTSPMFSVTLGSPTPIAGAVVAAINADSPTEWWEMGLLMVLRGKWGAIRPGAGEKVVVNYPSSPGRVPRRVMKDCGQLVKERDFAPTVEGVVHGSLVGHPIQLG